MTTRLSLRASSMDRLFPCPDSALPVENANQPNTPEARRGQAAHEVCHATVAGLVPDFASILAAHGLPASEVDDMERIRYYAGNFWEELGRYFSAATMEVPMEVTFGEVELEGLGTVELLVRGHADILSVVQTTAGAPTAISVLDWKTGYGKVEHANQVRTYAWLAYRTYGMPSSGAITGVEAWVRHGERQVHQFGENELVAFENEILAKANDIGRRRGAGDWCGYCPQEYQCGVRRDWFQSTMRDVLGAFADGEPEISRGALGGEFWDKLQVLKRTYERGKKLFDSELEKGPLPRSDGKTAHVLTQRQEDRILYSAAGHVLEEMDLDMLDLDDVITISKGQLIKAARGKASGPQVMAKLAEAGALVKKSKKKVAIVDIADLPDSDETDNDGLEAALRASLELGKKGLEDNG